MQLSSDGLDFIKGYEKLYLNAYQDQGKTWSIGWGATTYENGAKVKQGDVITEARATQLFNYHVGVAASAVNSLVTAKLTQSRYDAIVSLVYNIGTGNFRDSTIRKVINANPDNLTAIEAEFKKWVYVTIDGVKVVSNGLVNRRQAEAYMYAAGITAKKAYNWLILLVVAGLIYIAYRRS